MHVPWTYQKVNLLYSKEPLWNKIFPQKSIQIRRVKTCIKFLGASDHETVISLFEVS